MKRDKNVDKQSLNELIHLSKNLVRVFYIITIVGICLGVILALKQLNFFPIIGGILGVISPLFIGFIIAWLFNPLQKRLVDRGFNKVLAAIIIFIGIISLLSLFIYIFIPVLYKQVNDLITYIPSIFTSVSDFITNTLDKIKISTLDVDTIKHTLITSLEGYLAGFTSTLPESILNFAKSLVGAFGIILLSFVIGIYMLIDYDNILKGLYNLFPKKDKKEYIKLIENIGSNARKVVNGTLLVAFMVFICDTLGFAMIGLNAAVLFGFFAGFTDLIPYIGPYIGGGVAVIVGFTQSPVVGIGALIVAVIVQLVENYILQPVVMSKAMQLHPVTIMIGLLLFGYFFGIIGMIIATPCMAIIKEIYMFIKHRRSKLIEEE